MSSSLIWLYVTSDIYSIASGVKAQVYFNHTPSISDATQTWPRNLSQDWCWNAEQPSATLDS